MRVSSSAPAFDPLTVLKLTAQQQAQVAKLVAIDQHVRSHEQAHLAAAGGYARSGATFTYTRGPDGMPYAVAGEVAIDTSPVPGDPQATIRKEETVRAAALAPSDPSDQDRAVAASAAEMEATAQRQLDQIQKNAWLSSGSHGKGYAASSRVTGTLLSVIG